MVPTTANRHGGVVEGRGTASEVWVTMDERREAMAELQLEDSDANGSLGSLSTLEKCAMKTEVTVLIDAMDYEAIHAVAFTIDKIMGNL
ncbi:hypothetical protein NL676_024227 [Syzygium grande]|nr:hypothetical protein NL676_024227 [Syzygium grande]